MKSLPLAARLGSCALLATFAGLPLSAPAAYDGARTQTNFYLGGGIGYNKLEGEAFSGDTDGDGFEDERVSYKALAGFRLGNMLSLEAQYINFGTAEDGNNVVEADGFTLGAVLDFQVFQSVDPYLKAGVLFWDANGRFDGLRGSDDGTDFTYGAGLRFAVTNRVDFRAEYEAFELDETDVDQLSAIVQFNF